MRTEIYLKFKPFEGNFNTAVKSNFVRFSKKELDAFDEVLKAHRGTPLTRQQRSCPHCLLTVIKGVAEEYFKFKNSPAGKKADKVQTEDVDNGESTSESEE